MIEYEQQEIEFLQQISAAKNEAELRNILQQQDLSTSELDSLVAHFLPYIGGKCKQKDFIQQHLPNTPIDQYVSVFGGMMWDFLKLPSQIASKISNVTYNDLNPLNTNLFRCVVNQQYKELYEVVKDIPNGEKDRYLEYHKELYHPGFKPAEAPDFQTAMKYAYILTNGHPSSVSRASFMRNKTGFNALKNKLNIGNKSHQSLRDNLDRITAVTELDFEGIIQQADNDNTFLFVDPPYYNTEDLYANHNFGIQTHERLANVLRDVKSKFQLCYYHFPQLDTWYPQNNGFYWETKQFKTLANPSLIKPIKEELIIKNYDNATILDEKLTKIID